MRIIAGVTPGWEAYYVWHAERCCYLHNIVWVDDETNEYAEGINPYPAVRVHKAKKIQIIYGKVIIINPIEDDGDWRELFEAKPLKTDKPKMVSA